MDSKVPLSIAADGYTEKGGAVDNNKNGKY